MKRILILTNSINGLYSFRRELVEELIKEGYEIFISSPKNNKSEYFNEIGCKLIYTEINGRGTSPIEDFKLLIEYKNIIKLSKPYVVLTYTIKPNVYGGIVCRFMNIPYIINITGLGTAVEKRGILQKIALFLYKMGLKKANCVFFQNKENADFLNGKGVIKGRQRWIPGSGVNLNHYSVLDYPNDKTINFLFISRIMKEKGIGQYLEAARFIKEKYLNTDFHILGNCDEDYINVLKEYEGNGIIKYHGRQDDVREFHKISHCTIHPTYYPEGMSNVLLESAACGRPIITTNRSGCKEIVDDGINGYFVEQKNTQDLIDKVEKFLKLSYEEKKQMGLAGRTKVEKEFNREIVIGAYLKEIREILGDKNGL